MSKKDFLLVTEYARLMDVSRPAVTMALNKGKKLSGIESYEKIGSQWFLYPSGEKLKIIYKKSIVVSK
jgi:hypothetical protein